MEMKENENGKRRVVRQRDPKKSEKNLRARRKERKSRILPSILVSVAIPFVLGIVAPFEIYCGNIDEFRFSLGDFMPMCILLSVACATVLFAILWFIPKKIFGAVLAVLTAIAFMFFVQGTFLNQGIDSLKGDDVGAGDADPSTVTVNTVVWCVIIVAAVTAAIIAEKKKKTDLIKIGCIILCVTVLGTQLVSFLTLSLTTEDVFLPLNERGISGATESEGDGENKAYCMTRKNLSVISKNKNVFIFCVDRFDDRYAAETMEKYPELFDSFRGFTYFNDNTSLYGHTYPAVPYMLTRKELGITEHRTDYLDSTWTNAQTLKELKKQNYSVNIYTDSYYCYNDARAMASSVDNVIPAASNFYEVTNHFMLSWGMLRMSFYRCLPMIMKDLAGSLDSNTCNRYVNFDADYPEYTDDMKDIFTTVTADDFSAVEENVFTFLHFTGCHSVPYDENWEATDPEEALDITISVKNSFKIIGRYLDEMKRAGVYDDATIIITGDHAAAISDVKNIEDTYVKTRVTALFVKPAGAPDEPMKYSSAQVSQENLWATIVKSAGIETDADYGRSVFEVPEGEEATRRYIWHKSAAGGYIEVLYEIVGSARDPQNWHLVSETDMKKSLYN